MTKEVQDIVEEFREEYTHKSNPTGAMLMTMWRAGKDPEDAIRFILSALSRLEAATRADERQRIVEELREKVGAMPDLYGIFKEPWKGWEKDVDALAKQKGYRIDSISGWYARWQRNLTKNEILALLPSAKVESEEQKA